MTYIDEQRKKWFGSEVYEKNIVSREFSVSELHSSNEPVVLRNFVEDWPAVESAKKSDTEVLDYLMRFDIGSIVSVSVGPEKLNGRVFSNEGNTGLNVNLEKSYFSKLLEKVLLLGQDRSSELVYMASVDTEHCVKGFGDENSINMDGLDPIVSFWIGTKTHIAAHNDLPLNIVIVAGKLRFTLFPPNQTENLYLWSFEFTPTRRPISLVDFHYTDFKKFPKFINAMKFVKSSVLNLGDAIFILSMWWYHVEALGIFNVLLNYWWRTVPNYLGTPRDALIHATVTLRDLPENEKNLWRDVFENYVFGNRETSSEHVPDSIRGILALIDLDLASRARSYLLK